MAEIRPVQWKAVFHPKHLTYNILGVILITFALKGFMIPNKFLDGGITGISILLHETTHLPYGLIMLVLNIPFLFLGKKLLGPTFAVQTALTILLLAIVISVLPIPVVTSDRLLIALFGGGIIGTGMGFCIRGRSAADGAEILAVMTTRKIGLNTTEVIFGMNTLIFLAAAWSFGVSTALYSIVTYFAAVKSLDYVSNGIEHYTSLHIISSQSETIKSIIVNRFGKGIAILKGERGFLPGNFHVSTDCDIIVTVVTRLELLRIKDAVKEADPDAFMYTQYIHEASGGVLSRKTQH